MSRGLRWLKVALLTVTLLGACAKDDPAEPLRRQGNVLFKQGDFVGAAQRYEAVLTASEKPAVKDLELAALAHQKAAQWDLFAERLLQAAALKGGDAAKLEALTTVASTYLQQGNDLDKAEKYFGEVVALDPKNESALSWLAEISSRRGGARAMGQPAQAADLDVALARYDRLLEFAPDSAAHLINKRIVLMKYLEHLPKLKAAAEKDAETNAADPVVKQDFLDAAAKAQAKADTLKVVLDETTRRLVEVQKAAKAK